MSTGFPVQIGPYRPLTLLGRGSNSVVYLCIGPRGEEVALKWMDHPTVALVRRFHQEISTLERIENPHIVRHRDHGEWEGRPYLVMEYIQGHDLRVYASKLHKRPSKERYTRVRQIGQDLCTALEHLHRLGLVHRDLKPSNVMWTEAGRVVLTDFGIVKDLEGHNRTDVGMMIGTMAFAAPEQVEGDRVDTRADLFGLGATLYYLLTLQRPYEKVPRTPDLRPQPPSVWEPGIPPDLEAVVLRLMAHQPQHRYPDARAAAHALRPGRAEGVPIAGRRDALKRVARALRTAEAGHPICLRPGGPLGAGKGWLADMVRQGARARGVRAYEVREREAARPALTALSAGEPCVVVDTVGLDLPEGVAIIEVPLVPLGLADVRRTVVGVAPKTSQPALVSDRLHRLTGGIPGLLVPLITRYTEGEAIVLPDDVDAPALVDSFFDGLGLDELEILGVIALAWPPPSSELIEEVMQVPAIEGLQIMKSRGLVQENQGEWMLGANLFRSRIVDALSDPEGVASRIARYRSQRGIEFGGQPRDIHALIELGRSRLMGGSVAIAIGDIERARDLAHGLEVRDLEALALRELGLARMQMGRLEESAARFADATALARAGGYEEERRLCHVLRAQISMDQALGQMTGALAALDRLMPLEVGASQRTDNAADAMMYAVWSRVCAQIGDVHGSARREAQAEEALGKISIDWQIRSLLNLARCSRSWGNLEVARSRLERARSAACERPLLLWWTEAALASLDGIQLSLPDLIRSRLNPEDVQAMESLAGA